MIKAISLMHSKLFVVLSILLFVICDIAIGQELKGKIINNENKKPVSYATISMYNSVDSSLVNFKVSDEQGNFRFTGLNQDKKLRLIITSQGFSIYRKELDILAKQGLDLGVIELNPSSILLNEIVVVSEIPPVIIRNDTLEFNAPSFKTLPNALVEDLLRKLPGMRVDDQGNISVNGRIVEKILVDGRDFFGGNMKVATRNLPADIVDKVQVMKDPVIAKRNPDLPDSQIPQIINLKLNKAIKKGLFGKGYVGGGVKDRYEGGGILNIFRDTTQISVLGYLNNLNKAGFGFEDINRIGGFGRSGINQISNSDNGGYSVNGISLGGTGEGLQNSGGAGLNFNTIVLKDAQLNLQYFYGGIGSKLNQLTNTQQETNSIKFNTNSERLRTNNNNNHVFGGKLVFERELSSLELGSNFTIKDNDAFQEYSLSTFRTPVDRISNSINDEEFNSTDNSLNSTVVYFKRFKKPRRSLTFTGDYTLNSGGFEQFNNALTFFESTQSSSSLNQLRDTRNSNSDLQTQFSYSEPISKLLSANVVLSSQFFKNQNFLNSFDLDPVSGKYTIFRSALSEDLTRNGNKNTLSGSLRWRKDDLSVSAGVKGNALRINNTFLKLAAINQDYFYLNPTFNLSYKQLRVTYGFELQEPSATLLQPIDDNTNPLIVIRGNPALQPTTRNSLDIYYKKVDQKHSLNYYLTLYGWTEKDAIIRDRSITTEGIQVSRPVNVDDVNFLSAQYRISKDYKFSNTSKLFISHGLIASYRNTFVLFNSQKTTSDILSLTPSIEGRLNLKNLIEINQTFRYSFQNNNYESPQFADLKISGSVWQSELILRFPKKFVWETNFTQVYNSDINPGIKKTISRLNGGVSYLFMTNNRAQLKFSLFDVLDQNASVSRIVSSNFIQETQSNALKRYGLLTFTYNIRNFGGRIGGNTNPLIRF